MFHYALFVRILRNVLDLPHLEYQHNDEILSGYIIFSLFQTMASVEVGIISQVMLIINRCFWYRSENEYQL